MKKKHFSKIVTLNLISFLVLLLVSITYFFIYTDIFDTKKSLETLSLAIEEQTARNNELDAIQKNTKLKSADREYLNSLFVLNDGVVDFVELVESVAKKNGLTINTKNIESMESETLATLNKELMSVSVETKGGWTDTMQFLALLSNLPYKIGINSLNLSYSKVAVSKENEKEINQNIPVVWNLNITFDVVKMMAEKVETSGVEASEVLEIKE